jgi:hypothetical protein
MGPKDRALNQEAFRRMKADLGQRFGKGRFLALSEGKVIADAANFKELSGCLKSMGIEPTQALVVQAGVEYPESAVIF